MQSDSCQVSKIPIFKALGVLYHAEGMKFVSRAQSEYKDYPTRVMQGCSEGMGFSLAHILTDEILCSIHSMSRASQTISHSWSQGNCEACFEDSPYFKMQE